MELGCGVAPLPSMICSKFGAKYTVATDYIDALVEGSQQNIENNLDVLKSTEIQNNVSEETTLKASSLAWGDSIKDVCLNQDINEKFDIVLGADIMGVQTVAEQHMEIMRLLGKTIDDLTRPGSVVILSHTIRQEETENWFVDTVLGGKFEKIGEVLDDVQSRWIKYGRVAHNAKPGSPDRLVVVTLIKK